MTEPDRRRSRARGWWLPLFALLASAVAPVAAEEAPRLFVSPSIAFAPNDVRIRVEFDPTEASRTLIVEGDGADYFRSSELMLEGEFSPRVATFVFRAVPAGIYAIRAVLRNQAGDESAVTRRLELLTR